jgi:AraC-like DNA-binding protein
MKSKKSEPKRLTNEQFVPQNLPFTIYKQLVTQYNDLHWHEFYELCFVLSGQGMNIINGRNYPIDKGNLFLLTPADFHEIFPVDGNHIELLNIVFAREFLDNAIYQLLFEQKIDFNVTLDGANYETMKGDFSLVWTEMTERKQRYNLIGKATLERILIFMTRFCNTPSKPNSATDQHLYIQPALIYIQHHFREQITLNQAAKKAKLSSNYFSECFKNVTGVTFQSYLGNLRLSFAKSLLLASQLSITDICHASGYNTLTNFERAFKLEYKVSPRQMRLELHGLPNLQESLAAKAMSSACKPS